VEHLILVPGNGIEVFNQEKSKKFTGKNIFLTSSDDAIFNELTINSQNFLLKN